MSTRLKKFRPVIIIAVLIVSMRAVAFVMTGHGQVNQLQERVITRVKQNNEPVQIIKVEVSGRVISVGQKFPGGDDWFKGLNVTIKNVSDRPVRFVSVGIYIPRTFTPRPDNFAVSFLNFGKDDPPATDTAASGTEPLILPGKSVELKVTDEHLNMIKNLLELSNFPPQIFRIDLIVREVLFTDDTKWSGEQIFRRDPNDPNTWIRADGISFRIHDHTIRRATWNPDFFYLKSIGFSYSPPLLTPAVQSSDCYEKSMTSRKLCRADPYTTTYTGCSYPKETVNSNLGSFYIANATAICTYQNSTQGCRNERVETTVINRCSDYAPPPCRPNTNFAPVDQAVDSVPFPNSMYCDYCGCQSPIVVDASGNGITLTDFEGGVSFDLDSDGTPEQLAWTAAGSDNTWLSLDRNSNGTIDNGTELFGNYTPQIPSHNPNGFLALADFDKPANGGNSDGVIDSRDTIFSSLRLWQDGNHNGISEASELHTLPEFNVTSFSLDYHESIRRDLYGNMFKYRAAVNISDGRLLIGRQAWDVFLINR